MFLRWVLSSIIPLDMEWPNYKYLEGRLNQNLISLQVIQSVKIARHKKNCYDVSKYKALILVKHLDGYVSA